VVESGTAGHDDVRRANQMDNMFIGLHELTIDEKNRISIPASIRAALGVDGQGARLYLVPGEYRRTLALLPESEFKAMARALQQIPVGDKAARSRSLFFAAASQMLEVDKSGRVVLPQQSLEFAGIKRQIVLAADFNRWLIMNREEGLNFLRVLWESHSQELDAIVPENATERGKFWHGFWQGTHTTVDAGGETPQQP